METVTNFEVKMNASDPQRWMKLQMAQQQVTAWFAQTVEKAHLLQFYAVIEQMKTEIQFTACANGKRATLKRDQDDVYHEQPLCHQVRTFRWNPVLSRAKQARFAE
jgi:hypothetical protein